MNRASFRAVTFSLLVVLVAAVIPGIAGDQLFTQRIVNAAYGHASSQAPVEPLGTAFTYQGFITSSGIPADGIFDFEFSLFDAATAGAMLGMSSAQDVMVKKGYFTINLDFGPGGFNGSARWLAISVRPGDSAGSFTPLDPRQAITPAPYANYAATSPWGGLQNIPAGFADSVDDDTTYSAGPGLSLTDTQFMVDTNAVQARVSGNCAVGSAIRAIHSDGSVTCVSGSPANNMAPSFTRTPLDIIGSVGLYPSLAIGPDGLPLIAYRDNTAGELKLAHCDDANCTSATIKTLAASGNYPSVELGADDRILIIYVGGNGLVAAHCDDTVCSSATQNPLYMYGSMPSLQIGTDGLGLFSYFSMPDYDLKVAHCKDLSCSSFESFTLDSAANVTRTALTIGGDGRGLIAYTDGVPNDDLRIAHCEDIACTSATTATLDSASNVDIYLSIAATADGFGLVVYDHVFGSSNTLKAAHCQNAACNTASFSVLSEDSQSWVTVMQAPGGNGVIAYFGFEGLKVVFCTNNACTDKSIYTLDRNDASVVGPMNMEFGADGLPIVAYTSKSIDLVIAHCDDLFCAP